MSCNAQSLSLRYNIFNSRNVVRIAQKQRSTPNDWGANTIEEEIKDERAEVRG